MDKKLFYEKIKVSLFKGVLTQPQVEGMEALLNECEAQQVTDKRQIAYILGTTYHEVGGTMQPIEEIGRGKGRVYGNRVWINRIKYIDVPYIYYGRGFTQNTWRDNYVALTKAAKKQGHAWNFEHNPALLLQVQPSAWATIFAMRTGLYTGVSLSKYFNAEKADWINARRIVNLLDCAERIKGYSMKFYSALT